MPHASHWDPCPWIGLFTLLGDLILPDHCLPPDAPSDELRRVALPAYERSR